MYERFTDRARKVMQLANQEAQRFNHEYIGTEHVLLGLIKEGSGVAANVLKNLDVDLRKIRLEVEKLVQSGPDMVTMGKLPQTPRAKKVIEYAMEEARNLQHNYVGTEHVLLGLLREQEGVAAQVLINLGLKLEEVREEVLNLLGHGVETGEGSERNPSGSSSSEQAKNPKSKTPALDSFGRDLTELARQGKLDPVIGREKEIERAIQILCRRTKNNPVLLGEAGVGKTAIVEGFAQRVVEGNVPELLLDRRIVVLDLAMMVAGTADFTGYKQVNPDADLSFIAWPGPEEGKAATTTGFELLYTASAFASPEKQEAAAKFINWLATEEAQQMVMDTISLSVNKNVTESDDPIREQTVAALPIILQRLKKQGYSFVTVSEMLVDNPPPTLSESAVPQGAPGAG